ncbi:MAG: VWA domain-containing protein, partial [Anaerotignum sp.]|nr:VWA domain-containing protein [Anaerotignum sp.]
MKKNLTEIVFILDRSGSMSGLEQDTIGGFNSLIEKQKKEDGEAYISTVLFDHTSEVLHDRVDLKKIKPMTEDEYYVRGSTALLDAVGGAIQHIGNVHKYARKEDVPEKTIFVIMTDGYENASRRY